MDNRYNESTSPYKTLNPAYLRILLSLYPSPFQKLKPLLSSLEPTRVYEAYTMHSLLISYLYKFSPCRFALSLILLVIGVFIKMPDQLVLNLILKKLFKKMSPCFANKIFRFRKHLIHIILCNLSLFHI